MDRPNVVFVCVKNGGKSQIAAALMRSRAGDQVEVTSAGTEPGSGLNALAAETVREVGASMDGEFPKLLTEEMMLAADRLIVLGRAARVEPPAAVSTPVEVWDVDEPSERGIDGEERMRLVVADISERVDHLVEEITS